MGNPKVRMDISIGGKPSKQLEIELFADIVPKTAENFRQLCTGEFKVDGETVSYVGTKFTRKIPGFRVEGGDVTHSGGIKSISIYGPFFEDENFIKTHSGLGIVGMDNFGP